MLEKFKTRTIKFGGALIILAMLIIFLWGNQKAFDIFDSVKLIAAVSMYLIISLSAFDFRGIDEMFNEIWVTTQKTEIPKAEKLDMIASFLETGCSR